MIGLALIRALFPARFQRDYGDAWESVAEAILVQAREQGRGAYVRAWLELLMDTGQRAPVAHAREWLETLVGQPPQVAGMGVWAATRALSGHWIARPIQGFFDMMARWAVVFGLGAVSAFLLHFWLEQRATQQVLRSIQTPTDSMHSEPAFLAVSLLFVVGFLLLVMSKRSLQRGWRVWRRSGHSLLAPLLVFSLGGVLALHVILVSALNTLGYELQTVFISYPKHRDFPVEAPYFDQPASEWTPAHHYWFNLPLQAGQPIVKPERLEQWCALQEGAMQARRAEIQGRMGPGAAIEALLWNNVPVALVGYGCFSIERAFDEQLQMASFVSSRPDVFQLTWEPLSLFPLFDRITVGRYLVQPQLFPDVRRYCLLMADVQAQHRTMDGQIVNSFCLAQHEQWLARTQAQHPPAPTTRWQRLKWSLGLDHTGRIQHDLQGAPIMQREDLVWIREAVVANQHRWLDVSAASPNSAGTPGQE